MLDARFWYDFEWQVFEFFRSRECGMLCSALLAEITVDERMRFGADNTLFRTPRPAMTADDVSCFWRVVVFLEFLDALTVADATAMELTAFLVF